MTKPAARMGDATIYGGPIVQGSTGVLIGSPNGIACSVCPGGIAVGNPVNPMLGAKVLSNETDISLPGAMSFTLSRSYSSYQTDTPAPVGLLGPGWYFGFDASLLVNEHELILNDSSGRSIHFEQLSEGEASFSRSENLWLIRGGKTEFPDDHVLSVLWHSLPVSLKNNPHVYFVTSHALGPVWLLGYNTPYIPPQSALLPPELPKRRTLQGIYDRFGRGMHFIRETQGEFSGYLSQVIDGVGRHYRFELTHITSKRISTVKSGWGQDNGVRLSAIYLTKDPHYPELPEKPLVRYDYNERGELQTVYDRVGVAIRQFNYHPEHIGWMTTHQYIGRPPSQYEYDAKGRVILQHNQGGLDYTFNYSDNRTDVTDSLGRQDSYFFAGKKGLKRLIKHQRPDGSTIENRYDPSGRLIAVRNAGGLITEFELDIASGNLTAITTPDEKTTRFSYNAQGQLQEVIYPSGNRHKTAYDQLGRVISETNESGGVSRFYYADEHSNLISTREDALGVKQSFKWTACGLLAQFSDCSGKITHYDYNRDGNILHITMEEGLRNTYEYNDRGQRVSEHNAAGETYRYDYNSAGDLVKIHQPDDSLMTLHYDEQRRLTAKQYGGLNQQFHYDDAGRIHTLVNENGAVTRFEYDVMNRLVKEIGFDGRSKCYSYNALQQLVTMQDVHLTTHYRYDLSGHLINSEIIEAGKTVDTQNWQYNEYEQLTEVNSQSGDYQITVCFERDNVGRILQETQCVMDNAGKPVWQHQVKHAYQIQGLRAETTPDGLPSLKWLTYGSGHLLGLSCQGKAVVEFERDNLHREKSLLFGKSQLQRQYNAAGRLAHIDFSVMTGIHQPSQYHYDVMGQLIRITQANNQQTQYHYDKVGRLRQATSPLYQQQYDYDLAGNRIISDRSVLNSNLSDIQFSSNRLQYDDNYDYTYDDYGNLISKVNRHDRDEAHYYQYDKHHRLTHYQQIKHGESITKARYCYDAFSRRIQKQVMSEQSKQTVWYGWDGDNLVLTEKDNQRIHTVYYPNSFVPLLRIEGSIPVLTQPLGEVVEQALTMPLTDEVKRQLNSLEPNLINNSLTAEDLNWIQQSELTPQQLSQFIKPTSSADLSECTIQYYNCNHLGTPQMLVDLQGNVVWQADYDPWGNRINEKNPSNLYQPIRMQGQHYDEESGLHYNRYRYYDPNSGRYITQDPIGLLGGMNVYKYPLNPLQYIDFLGLVDINLFPDSEPIHDSANNVPDKTEGFLFWKKKVFTVGGHGNPQLMVDQDGKVLTAKDVADMIKNHEDYKDGMTVELLSCNVGAGENSFAQQVANELKTTVKAADKYVWYFSDGSTTPAGMNADGTMNTSDIGELKIFKPK